MLNCILNECYWSKVLRNRTATRCSIANHVTTLSAEYQVIGVVPFKGPDHHTTTAAICADHISPMPSTSFVQDVVGRSFRYVFVDPSSYATLPIGSFISNLAEAEWDFMSLSSICSKKQEEQWIDAIDNHMVEEKLEPVKVHFSTADSWEIMARMGIDALACCEIKAKAERSQCESLKVTIAKRVLCKIEDKTWRKLIETFEPDTDSNFVKTLLSKWRPGVLRLIVVRAVIKAAHLKVNPGGQLLCLVS